MTLPNLNSSPQTYNIIPGSQSIEELLNDSKDVSNPDETGTTAVVNDKTDLKSED